MKKTKIKKIVLIFFSILLVSIAAFFACKQIDELNNPMKSTSKLMQFYDSSLVESFKKEPIAKEFLQEMNKIPVEVVNGILSFKSVEDVNAMYDLIIQYSDRFDGLVSSDSKYSKYDESANMPAYPIAYLFETKLGFNSLRMNIEEEILILERGNGIPDDNDPDDHYTVSPYMRTLLSPDCEIIVNDLICVHYDEYAIGVMYYDWKTLKELHQYQSKNNFDEKKALEFCAGKQNAFVLTTGSEPSLHVDYTYTPDSKNPETIQFNNYSCSEAYKDMEYLWDFGDGATSTERNPKHTFKQKAGTVNVCLSVNLPNVCKLPTTECQTISFPAHQNNTPEFSWTEGIGGTVYFNCTYPSSSVVAKYLWRYTVNGPEIMSNTPATTYQYSQNGSYNVRLTVEFYDSGPISTTKNITVKNVGIALCCDGNEREAEKNHNYDYNGNSYRIKQVIRVTNAFWAHRMVSKTIHQKKKSGAWYDEKADYINTGFDGIIYYPGSSTLTCGSPGRCDDWYTPEHQRNLKRLVWDYGVGAQFNVSKNTLSSKHYLKHGGIVRINDKGPSIARCD